MEIFARWILSDGRRVIWQYDEDYQTVGSYAYETDEETKKAEEWELERLQDGRLVALVFCIESKCETCGHWAPVDSLCGIVIEPDEATLKKFFLESVESGITIENGE